MQANHLQQHLLTFCGQILVLCMSMTLVAIMLHFKQFKKITFEMAVLILNFSCLTFVMWITGCAEASELPWMVIVSGIPCLLVLVGFNPNKQRLKRLRNREDIPEDTIYNQFFAETHLPKDTVLEVWNEVATLLHVPPGKLRPSDRFDKELSAGGLWLHLDNAAVKVNEAAQSRLKKLEITNDFLTILTLNDYIQLLCKPVPQNQFISPHGTKTN